MAIPFGNSNCNACSCKKNLDLHLPKDTRSLHVFFPKFVFRFYLCVCVCVSLGACNKAWADLQLICKKEKREKDFVLE